MKRIIRTDDPKQYGIAEVLALIASASSITQYRSLGERILVVLDGEEVKITTRLRTYLKGTDCVWCGAKGVYFRKTRQSNQPRSHLNLYAIKDGLEVLMTSDHIIPRSKGGPTILENLQPMCHICNGRKGNNMPEDSDG